MHLKRHEMSLADYIAVHGEPTPVKTTYHRCHLCQAVILFTRSRLTTHLSKHKVTVRDYGNSYLSRVRSEKANVLVRKGLLTEPTRCLNKIPKQIKIRSVGPRSMDSDSQHMFSQKRKKRSPSPSEKRSKLKISHVRSMANENHQQIKVDKERESSGSGISLLFFLSRSFFFNSVFR